MILKEISTKSYEYELVKPFSFSSGILQNRKGFYVFINAENITGMGEIAPLDGFSPDYKKPINLKINEVLEAINKIKNNFHEDIFFKILDDNTIGFPSIQFGFETAMFDLLSQRAGIPLCKYWNSNSLDTVLINEVDDVQSSNISNSSVIKLKMTDITIKNSFDKLIKILDDYPNINLRLDFNGDLDLPSAIKWCKKLTDFPIDYIEQPLAQDALEDLCELRFHTDIPIAVDESLVDIKSAEMIIEHQAADVFIIKPMVSGGYRKSQEISDLAKTENIKTVITSTLESNIGLMANVHIAAALEVQEPCGFSTWKIFSEKPIKNIMGNKIKIPHLSGLGVTI